MLCGTISNVNDTKYSQQSGELTLKYFLGFEQQYLFSYICFKDLWLICAVR